MDNPNFRHAVSSNDAALPADVSEDVKDSLTVLTFLSQDIMQHMGKDFLGKVPFDLLERFCMATVNRNDPTGDLLFKLVTNFMAAYANLETTDEALKAFDFLEYLSGKD
ncbi:hypothetical protein GIW05_00815 [Pseudomonas syringae]|uniref:hypothetical protein n=1 Tax=Pseudomonas syringae TaxID=317 RepID=UPI001F433268|nr:hypothetical protein [Pseudomonas syringae]MCF5382063.1 hypothetical protein [Pseudomonas syringae]MCF5419353.1 hypothetical protein [Pseudomonas syringae]MCF5455033.1 hypothetical protein [Pseudomonas syringae]MCF5460937.1 hypothetical protein [Pseudomonas syringae]